MINNFKDFSDRNKLMDKKFLESITIPNIEFEFQNKLHHYKFLEFGMMSNQYVWKYENQDPQEGNGAQFSHYVELTPSILFEEDKMIIILEFFSLQEKFYKCKFKEGGYVKLIQDPIILFSQDSENKICEFLYKLSSGRIDIDDIPGESKF